MQLGINFTLIFKVFTKSSAQRLGRRLVTTDASPSDFISPCTDVLLAIFISLSIIYSLPICPPSVPGDSIPAVPKKKCEAPGLQNCFDPRCSEKNGSQTCEGIVGCYWCKNDKDDVPLKEPYCASSKVCFRGREGTIISLSVPHTMFR